MTGRSPPQVPLSWSVLQLCRNRISSLSRTFFYQHSVNTVLMSLPSPCKHCFSLFRSYWARRLKICPLLSSSSFLIFLPLCSSVLSPHSECVKNLDFCAAQKDFQTPLSCCSTNHQMWLSQRLTCVILPCLMNTTSSFFCVLINKKYTIGLLLWKIAEGSLFT